jgi:hypothetical protein
MERDRELERFVLNIGIDWAEFHRLLDVIDGCNHDHTQCRQILAGMGLDDKVIEKCLSYLPLQGGKCDCEVAINVNMTNPRPLTDFSCADCGHDYDEDYMVRDDIWRVYGVGNGMLCIGCLEKRLGRQLCSQDFTKARCNDREWATKSLRLRGRLTRDDQFELPAEAARKNRSQ